MRNSVEQAMKKRTYGMNHKSVSGSAGTLTVFAWRAAAQPCQDFRLRRELLKDDLWKGPRSDEEQCLTNDEEDNLPV